MEQTRLDAIRALKACGTGKDACSQCRYDELGAPECLFRQIAVALECIDRLTADLAAMRTENPILICEMGEQARRLAAMTAERDAMRERAEDNPMSDATNASHKEFIDASKALDSLGNAYLLTGVALEHDIRVILTGAHKLKKAAALLDVFAHSLRTVRAERDRLRAELDVMEAGTNADRAH